MKGAEDIRDIILELMEHVEKFAKLRGGAFGVWDIVDPMSLQEQRRRRDPSASSRNKKKTHVCVYKT